MTVIALAGLLPLPAAADDCVRILGGAYHSSGCVPLLERSADRAEGLFWQQRSAGEGDGSSPLFPLPSPPDRRLPGPLPSPLPPTRNGPTTLDDLHLVPDGHGGYRGTRPGFHFAIDRDGTVHFEDKPPVHVSALFLLGMVGVFDLTDLLIRLHGGDPYSYDKGLVMALTRPMREQMTDTDRARRLARALRDLPRELATLWDRADLDAGARHELLFRLWDDLAETGDDPELRAAEEARAILLDFVAKQLPAGSVFAFTPDELARLNSGRRSRVVFAPY